MPLKRATRTSRFLIVRLAVENVLGEPKHVGRHLNLGQLRKIIGGVAHLVGVAQRGTEEPPVIRLKRNDALAFRKHKPPSATIPL